MADQRFYPAGSEAPDCLVTEGFVLRPLAPEHVELDYAALMVSKQMLRMWSGSRWPEDDFTVEDNLADLEAHELEHQERVAFTYTVLNPLESICLGCVYIQSLTRMTSRGVLDQVRERQPQDYEAAVGFWVTEPYLGENLDMRLLETLIDWFRREWKFSQVLFQARQTNVRQLELLERASLRHHLTQALPDGRGRQEYWG